MAGQAKKCGKAASQDKAVADFGTSPGKSGPFGRMLANRQLQVLSGNAENRDET